MRRACVVMIVAIAVALTARPVHAEKWLVTGDGDDILGNIHGNTFVPCLGERIDLREYPHLTFRDAGDSHCDWQAGIDSAEPDVPAADTDEREGSGATPQPDRKLAAANKHIEKVLADYRMKHPATSDGDQPEL